MPIEFSAIMPATRWENGEIFSADSIKLHALGETTSPIAVLDDFRVRGQPFGPHPHAGFSALTYVFEDSPGRARSRDSLGNDFSVGPGGIIWFQAGRGALHHELPADEDGEIHGAQIFVKLSIRNKLIAPRTFWLEGSEVPEWRNAAGDRVRVAVGAYQGVSSPLVPAEPLDLLDVALRQAIPFDLPTAHHALVYVREGGLRIRADGRDAHVSGGQALALRRGGGRVSLEATDPARFLLLSGHEQHEPAVMAGPFIMNDALQIRAAEARFRAGEMGTLAPLPVRAARLQTT